MMTDDNQQVPDIHEEMEELTRQKVVRQLHDGLTQTVSALAMRINYARRLMTTDPEAAGVELEKVEDLTRAATKEIRHIIFLLRPESQGKIELISELESLAEKMGDLFDLDFKMNIDEVLVNQLPNSFHGVIYGIVEEVIDSARQINEKSSLFIGLSLAKSDLALLKIEDQVEEESKDKSFQVLDLTNIQSYASLIDGSVMVGKDGNLLQVMFPVDIKNGASGASV